MRLLNGALKAGDGWETVAGVLRDPGLRLPPLDDSQSNLCLSGLRKLGEDKDLEYDETKSLLQRLHLAANISARPDSLKSHLSQLGLVNVQPDLMDEYSDAIAAEFARRGGKAPLSPEEIQAIIDQVNRRHDSAACVQDLAALIGKGAGNLEEEKEAWSKVSSHLPGFNQHLIPLYSRRLQVLLGQFDGDASSITMEDLQRIVDDANADEERAAKTFLVLRTINDELSLDKPDPQRLHQQLKANEELLGVKVEPHPHLYASLLKAAKKEKSEKGTADWQRCELATGDVFFANSDGSDRTLNEREGTSRNLSLVELAEAVREVNESANFYAGRESDVVRAQAAARMALARKKYKDRLEYLASQEDAARKIQSHMRRRQAGLDWRRLMSSPDPPLPLLRKFLRPSDADYDTEMNLQRLRAAVSAEAAQCQTTDKDLHDMDVKIGLLVGNVINLEEVLRHGQKIKAATDVDQSSEKGLGKEEKKKDMANRRMSRRLDPRLDLYQQLVYLLQTQPAHLTGLALSKGQSPQSLAQTIVLPVFGYAAQGREEFLLCRLLQHSLRAQIESLESPEELSKASIAATIASVTRQMVIDEGKSGKTQDRLTLLIRDLLSQAPEHINIDPLEIYKYVVGPPKTGLTALDASKDPKVAEIFQRSLLYLKEWTEKLVGILGKGEEEKIPYPVRLSWRLAEEVAAERWKDSKSKDRLKWIGSLWLDQWLRPRLLALDDTDVVKKGAKVSEDQRQICASVARLLSFAVDNLGFGEETAHLAPLNQSIGANHIALRPFLQKLLQVPTPEEFYGRDELSDLTASRQPTLSLSLGALHKVHESLLAYNPPKGSELAQILKQLGPIPNLPALATIFCEESSEEGEIEKRTVTLHLRPPPSLNGHPMDEGTQQRQKFLRAKTLLREILLCQGGANVNDLLDTPASAEAVTAHSLKVGDGPGLEQRKEELAVLLDELETAQLVSSENNYQELVSAMADDVRSESAAREARQADLLRFQRRLEDLRKKKAFQREQAEAYNAVIQGCLNSLNPKAPKNNRNSTVLSPTQDLPPSKTLKYAGDRLGKKKVLLDIRDVPNKKWSDHKFEITNNAGGAGLFDLHYRIGDKTQDRRMNIQELLKLEYDGVESVTVFSGVVFALSPLLLLLNRKFHC